MKFLSVCSGIEAASVAWQPLGWKAVAFSEIEPFPCAVLAHHYPDTPNWGDMTKYKDWPDVSIDLICGGTPCQSFSVAGLRKGLDDPRGNLMLTFGAIAAKYRPKWLVWENVPGVLSSNGGADFGAFLGILGELGYGFAYRVLDAQYFGVAQRRRRVFVVGCLGDWRSAAAVLFELHSMQGHPAPSRQAGKGFAADTEPCLTGSGRGVERTGETRGQDPVIAVETLCVATGQAGAEIGADMAPTLNCNHEATYFVGAMTRDVYAGGMGGRVDAAAQGYAIPAYTTKLHNTTSNQSGKVYEEYTAGLDRNSPPTALLTAMQVRRLTPVECARLQGFPDHYLDITVRGKPAADGPKYKALGNSWAVPNVRWIGERIGAVAAIQHLEIAA